MTSDVRVEIAERMRGPFDVCECVGHTYLSGTLYGMQVCARDEIDLRNGMRWLADLIDPTCEVEAVERVVEGEFDQTIGYAFHLTCGHCVMRPYTDIPPCYCDECGRRVVRDDD